jgi:hypothetical protein
MPPPLVSVAILSRNPDHLYLQEILDHAGIVYHLADEPEGPAGMRGAPLWVVLAHGRVPLDGMWVAALEDHVRGGGALVYLGAPAGLESLFGVTLESGYNQVRPEWLGLACDLGEGYAEPFDHPIVSSAPRPLHVYGGAALRAENGTRSLAGFRDRYGENTPYAAGVARDRRSGNGPMVCWAVDLARSIHLIQHGIPVVRDGVPAPDGSAPIDDDILKAEDGLVLDWRHDRSFDPEAGFSYFDTPVADHLKQWLAASILWCAEQADIRLPLLGYYPKGVPAVAHLSLDTDNNDPDLARSMLARLAENGIPATWCHLAPGYPRDSGIAERLEAEGHEIAFHFNAGCEPGKPWTWNEVDFRYQHAEVLESTGVEQILANKNHFTRWEGCTEFFNWCVRAGIEIDSTKGPSKPGTLGFPFGTCHPWFPADRDGRRIDCFELCFLTQDPVVTVPACVTQRFHRAVARVDGITHFLFHPAHIEKPGVAAALAQVIAEGKARDAEWWTAARINCWERNRRTALLKMRNGDNALLHDKDLNWLVLDPTRQSSEKEWLGFRFGKL